MTLSSLHERWLNEVLGAPAPSEPGSTCAACAMCQPAQTATHTNRSHYSPQTKCCTYWPTLPNYLVGSILRDATSESGHRLASDMISTDLANPLGLAVAPWYQALYSVSSAHEFGTSERLLCPFYTSSNGGTCAIWRSRNSVCSTYFCKLTRGARSQDFWSAAKELLGFAERSISVWAAHANGVAIDGIPANLATASDRPQLEKYTLDGRLRRDAEKWRLDSAERAAFYISCYDSVARLTWQAIEAIGGTAIGVRAARLKSAHTRLVRPRQSAAPEMGRLTVARADAETFLVATYRSSDAQQMHRDLLTVLPFFDGRPTSEAIETIAAHSNIALTSEDVDRLIDYGILCESEGPRYD